MLRALLAIAALTLVACGSAGAASEPTTAPGTRVAGVDIGGLPLSQAAGRLEAAFGPMLRSTIEVRVGAHRLHLTQKGGRIRFDPLCSARTATLCVSYDEDRLDAFLDRVQRSGERDPRDARLRYTVTKLKVERSRDGLDVDRAAGRAKVEAALRDPYAPRVLRQKLDRTPPDVTTEDLEDRHGTVVTIHRRVFRLRLFKDLEQVASYRVAVGMPGHATPTGRFHIANKAVDPAWSAPDRPWAGAYRNEVIAGGSAQNPLKARWLGVVSGVGIHGTDATWSLGRRASHGCIRMSIPAVKRLYERVPVGALVMIK
jgi:lipoprotein-anchoring transpeptidase ErfK/SrfK